MGKPNASIRLYRRSLSIRQQQLYANYPNVAQFIKSLGCRMG